MFYSASEVQCGRRKDALSTSWQAICNPNAKTSTVRTRYSSTVRSKFIYGRYMQARCSVEHYLSTRTSTTESISSLEATCILIDKHDVWNIL